MRAPLLALGLTLAPLAAQVQPAAAAEAWQRGDAATALAEFERAADANPAPGPLLYNAGLCAQRLRQFPRARWLWQRAAACMPRDPELHARLREVEEVLGSENWTRSASGPSHWLGQLHVSELLWLTIALQVLGWTGHFLARARLGRTLGQALLGAGLLVAAFLIWQQWGRAARAVIASEEVAVRAAPADSAAVPFKLRAGELVELGARTGDWRAVHHPRGRGFVSSAALLVIE